MHSVSSEPSFLACLNGVELASRASVRETAAVVVLGEKADGVRAGLHGPADQPLRRPLGMLAMALAGLTCARRIPRTLTFDGVEVVVNVVGGVRMQPLMDKSPESCVDDIQRNFGYVIESTRHAVPLLRRSRGGACIINFTTIEAHRAAGGFAVYAGAKAATTNFSKAMALELGPEGMRVNVIAPDTTDSPGNRKALPADVLEMNADVPPEWWMKAFEMYIPLGVPPSTDDLANAVLFLTSDLARSITGQVLHVDGGTGAAPGMMSWPDDGGITLSVPAGKP